MNMPKVPLEDGDRVSVVIDGKQVKGRVAEVLPPNGVKVTFSKDDTGKFFERNEVMALYRYVPQMIMTEIGPKTVMGILPLVVIETDTKEA
jgi:hypothetical protein